MKIDTDDSFRFIVLPILKSCFHILCKCIETECLFFFSFCQILRQTNARAHTHTHWLHRLYFEIWISFVRQCDTKQNKMNTQISFNILSSDTAIKLVFWSHSLIQMNCWHPLSMAKNGWILHAHQKRNHHSNDRTNCTVAVAHAA